MQTCKILIVVLGFFGAPNVGGVVGAQDAARMMRLPVTAADDVTSVTGADIYRFAVAVEAGAQFEVVISTQDSPDAKPQIVDRQSFTRDDAGGMDLLLSFLPRDEVRRGVLLSQDEKIVYRLSCPKCLPPEVGTVISLPLNEVPGDRKTVLPMNAELSRRFSNAGEICLLAIVVSRSDKPVSTEKSFPMAKVCVVTAESFEK